MNNESASEIRFAPAGDQGILLNFGDQISEIVNERIRGMIDKIRKSDLKGVTEMIPSYTSLLVLYDRRATNYRKLERQLRSIALRPGEAGLAKKRIHCIPVCYEDAYALDLKDVAEHSGMTPEEVIRIHTGRDYLIYMLGFLPGFVYLGGMDEAIACPRLTVPRTCIPAGSVGIGGSQTGIYPLESPGGWRIIGKTPVKVYDPARQISIIYEMGEYIRFVPISAAEFEDISARANAGTYTHTVIEEEKEAAR